MQRIGAAGRGRTGGEGLADVGEPLPNLDVIGARGAEGVGDGGVRARARAEVRPTVVVLGQFIADAGEHPQGAVEAGVVDVEHHGIARDHRDGIILHAAVSCGDDGCVRDRGRVRDGGVGQQIEGAGQGHGCADAAIGRALRLDHIGGAAALAGRAGEEQVAAVAAAERVDPAVAAQDVGVPVAGQGVGMDRARNVLDQGQGVHAGAAGCGARAQIDGHARAGRRIVGPVGPRAAVQRVVAEAPDKDIVVVAAVQRVIAGPAVQQVVAAQPVDGVDPAEAADGIGESGARNRLVGDVATDHHAARRGGRDGLVRELQELDIAHRHGRLACSRDRPDAAVPDDGVAGQRAAKHDGVRSQTAVDHIGAAAADDEIVRRVAADLIRGGSADGVFDHGADGDRDVAHQSAHAGEGALAKVDDPGRGEAGEVKGVDPAGVPGAEHQGGRCAARAEPDLARRRVEPVNSVARPGGHVGAVETLGRRDVVEQGRGRVNPRTRAAVRPEVSAGQDLTEIAHDRILEGVLIVYGAGFVGDPAFSACVIRGWMAETDRVADLVQQGQLAVVQLGRRRVYGDRTVDPDIALSLSSAGSARHAARQVGEGRGALLAAGIVTEQDGRIVGILASGILNTLEGDVGHVRPGRHGEDGGDDLVAAELCEPGRIRRHGRDRVTEGIGYRRRGAEAGGPALVGTGDLGAGVRRAQRRLAVRSEGPPVVSVEDDAEPAAVISAGGAVEAGAAGANLIAGDGPEGRVRLGRVDRLGHAVDGPDRRIKAIKGLKKTAGVAAVAVAEEAVEHGAAHQGRKMEGDHPTGADRNNKSYAITVS